MGYSREVVAWLGLALLLVGGPGGAAPYDLVPRGDWSYDALARWAARGLIKRESDGSSRPAREFYGDEPLTREAMAAMVASLASHPEAVPAADLPVLEHLVRELAPELERARHDPGVLARAVAAAGATDSPGLRLQGSGFLLGRLGHESEDSAFGRGVYRAAGQAALNPWLLGTVSITNQRQLPSTDDGAFPRLEHAVVRLRTHFADWEIGRTSRRWGPGWGGAMLLSDDAPALTQVAGRKRLSLGFLGHDYTFEQFLATLNDEGGRRYIIARRLSRPFGRRAGASISEAVKSTSTQGLGLALVLPLYLYADLTFDDVRNSDSVNYLAAADVWYAPSEKLRFYGEAVMDDVTAPFGLGNYSVPRKIGLLFGLHLPKLNAGRTDVRLEWVLTDGERPGSSVQEGGTYIHRNRTLSWFHNDLPIGHRMGQNRRGPFIRVRHRLTPRWTVIGDWEEEKQWRDTPAVGDRRRGVLYAAYDLQADRWLALRLERTGGALGRETRWEIQAAHSF
jgi:hypothetical protein